MNRYYLAVDIGASSGRHILGWMENGKMNLREIYRFSNGMEMVDGTLCWNLVGLFEEIKAGMRECKKLGINPESMHRHLGCGLCTSGQTGTCAGQDCRLQGQAHRGNGFKGV